MPKVVFHYLLQALLEADVPQKVVDQGDEAIVDFICEQMPVNRKCSSFDDWSVGGSEAVEGFGLLSIDGNEHVDAESVVAQGGVSRKGTKSRNSLGFVLTLGE